MWDNPRPKPNEQIPDSFSYPIVETLKLPTPVHFPRNDIWEILRNRKSSRTLNSLSMEEIGMVLWASSKVMQLVVQENTYVLTHRPSASAGARHPIDIILSSPILNGNKSFYYYNPFAHTLNRLSLDINVLKKFQQHVNSILDVSNATVFWFMAHPSRTEAKYDNSASLIWRDAGALINCVQLACSASNINSCPIGSLGEPYISELFQDVGCVYGTGGIAIG